MNRLKYDPTKEQRLEWMGEINQLERDLLGGSVNPYFLLAGVDQLHRLKDEDPDLRAARAAACAEQVGRSVEPLAEVYALTGDDRDLDVALYFLKRGDHPDVGLHIVDALGARKQFSRAREFIDRHQWSRLALPWCRLYAHSPDRELKKRVAREIEQAGDSVTKAEGAAFMYERTGAKVYLNQLLRTFGPPQPRGEITTVVYYFVKALARRGRLDDARSIVYKSTGSWAKIAAYAIATESLNPDDLRVANHDIHGSVPAPYRSNAHVHDTVLLKHVEHAVKSGDYKQARVLMDSMQDLCVITRAWCAIAAPRSCDCMNPMEHAQSRAEQMSSDRGSYGTERIGEAQCAIVETRLKRLEIVDLGEEDLKPIRDIAVKMEHTLWRCRAFLKIWQWRLRGSDATQA